MSVRMVTKTGNMSKLLNVHFSLQCNDVIATLLAFELA